MKLALCLIALSALLFICLEPTSEKKTSLDKVEARIEGQCSIYTKDCRSGIVEYTLLTDSQTKLVRKINLDTVIVKEIIANEFGHFTTQELAVNRASLRQDISRKLQERGISMVLTRLDCTLLGENSFTKKQEATSDKKENASSGAFFPSYGHVVCRSFVR